MVYRAQVMERQSENGENKCVMADAVTFWLDNKASSGVKVAEIGKQALVSYRERFYVVEDGAACMRGSRPLHYSKSSLPALWKRAMRGILPKAESPEAEPEFLPRMTITKKERTPMNSSETPEQATDVAAQLDSSPPQTAKPPRAAVKAKKSASPLPSPALIPAACPYCQFKHDLPLDRGKNGKPFFVTCEKCSQDFAVRFAPVTVYQAQVAAFK